MSSVSYMDDDGQFVTVQNGTLRFGDAEMPIVDGQVQMPDTPFSRAVAAAEWDLIKRYDRGEFDDAVVGGPW